jgi:hypothetical protein
MLGGENMLEITRVDVSKGLNQFIERDQRFGALPSALKKIAINTAQTVLGYKDEDLSFRAGEIDAEAIKDGFAHDEQEESGKLLEKYQTLHNKLLERQPFEEVQRIGLGQLRQMIASRMSRIALAKQLGYQPGKYAEIVHMSDFQAANDLSWQAVREFQTKS